MAIPSITHNSPLPGHIAWGAFTIQLNGVAYGVGAGSTAQRWVWWEYKNGTPVLNAGPDVPAEPTALIKNGHFRAPDVVDPSAPMDWLLNPTGLWYNAAHLTMQDSDGTMLLQTKLAAAHGPKLSQLIDVTPGQTLRFEASIRHEASSGALYVMLLNPAGTAEIVRTTINGASLSAAQGTFYQVSGTMTIPAGQTSGQLMIMKYNGALDSRMWIRDVRLYDNASPPPLTDDDLVLFGNKNGIGVRVQSTNFVDGELLVDGSIFADALSTNLIQTQHIATEGIDAGVVKFGLMHGDRIQVNTLDGDKIIGQTIATNKLMIGSLDNLLHDPTFLQPLGSDEAWKVASGATIHPTSGRGGQPALRIANSSSQQTVYNTTVIPCEPGEWYNLSILFYQTGASIPAGSVGIGAQFKLANGTFVWPSVTNTAVIPAGTVAAPSRINGRIQAPANSVSLEVYIVSQAANSAGVLFVDYASATRAMTGELIVDGSIKSDHIITTGLDAQVVKYGFMHGDRIQVETLKGDRLIANSIGVEKLVVGDTSNLAQINESYSVGFIFDTNHVVTNGWSTRSGNASQYFMFRSKTGPLLFKTGDRLRVEFDAYADVAFGANVQLWTYGPTNAGQVIGSVSIATEPQRFEVEADVTVDTNGKIDFLIGLTSGALVGRNVFLRDVRAYRMTVGELIVDGSIVGDHIQSKTIIGDHLSADVILAKSRIAALGPAGQSVELKPEGFFVYGPNSEGNPAYVSFPTEGGADGKPNIISGALRATTLTVEGNPTSGEAATFRGTNALEVGSTLILRDAVAAPPSEPIAEYYKNTEAMPWGSIARGSFSSGDASQTFHGSEQAVYTMVPDESPSFGARIYKTLLATGDTTRVGTIVAPSGLKQPLAITYVNNSFYIAWMRSGGAGFAVTRYTVSDSTWTLQQNVNLATFATANEYQSVGLGNDGTNLWVADLGSTTAGGIRFRRFANTLATTVAETINTTHVPVMGFGSAGYFGSLSVGNFDFGARKFVLTYSYESEGRHYDMSVYSTTGVREVANLVELYRDSFMAPGFLWTGTSNAVTTGSWAGISFSSGYMAHLDRYTGPRTNVLDPGFRHDYRWAGYTYYQASPVQETVISPTTLMMMKSRWPYRVTVGRPPTGASARIYLSESGVANHNAAMRLQGVTVANATVFNGNTYVINTANPPVTNTFYAGTPSRVISQQEINRAMTISTTLNSTAISTNDPNMPFYRFMIGAPITGSGIRAGTFIAAVTHGGTTATLSQTASSTLTAVRNMMLPRLEMRGDGDLNVMGDFISPALPIRMASGVVNITVGTGTTTVYATVVFPSGRFTRPPTVIANQIAGNANFYAGGANSITTTQFTANASKTGPSGQTVIPISWVAIQDG